MTMRELKAFAEENKIALPSTARKEEVLNIIKRSLQPKQIALYFKNPVHSSLGTMQRGYHVFTAEEAEKWLQQSKRIRIATPQEVAEYYGV